MGSVGSEFRYLFTPVSIGHKQVRNRIVFSGHGTLFAREGLPSAVHREYYRERARGGVGLIVTEITAVHPSTKISNRFIQGYDKRVIPAFREVADAVHAEGALLLSQVWHGGRQGIPGVPWAPSPIPCPRTRTVPHPMEEDEIQEVIAGFATTAAHVQEAGLDGVELHGAHGYLLQQFVSPLSNQRTDAWGGSFENRMRFPREVLHAVRSRVGRDFIVGMRISADELLPGGLTMEDTVDIVKTLTQDGLLDFVSVSLGTYAHLHLIVPTAAVPPAYQVHLAAAIRRVTSIPIITVGRITDPQQAEKIVAAGSADLVAMTRAQIADPELANKARQGRLDEIRHCISCNEGCLQRNIIGLPISCIQNPAVGREAQLGVTTLTRAARKRRVLIIGGGPAGMRTAVTAAARGHEVQLFEADARLGGEVRVMARAPYRDEYESVVRHLEMLLRKQGAVDIRLGRRVEAEDVAAMNPDVVVVAAGAEQLLPPGPDRGPAVVGPREVLLDEVRVPGQVVVVDREGRYKAGSVAEYLADRGVRVCLVTTLPLPGHDLAGTLDLPLLPERLLKKGVEIIPNSDLLRIDAEGVELENVFTRQVQKRETPMVICVTGMRARDTLAVTLRRALGRDRVFQIGDCLSPRGILDAIREGELTARSI